MTFPFFSVIIPAFDRREFLKTAVASVLAQTDTDWELIVVDDGSADGTREWLAAQHDPRMTFISQSNHGPAHARNRGVENARGPFVCFLDSDDRWVPGKLKTARAYINKYKDIKIFHTEEAWYRQGNLLNQKKKHKKPDGWVYAQALPLCCISISTVVIHRSVFEAAGLFDESLPACEDYDFWLRAACRFPVKLIPECLTLKDGGRPDQVSARVWGLDRFRIKALLKMLQMDLLSAEHRRATRKVLRKKCRIMAQGARKRGKDEEAESYLSLTEGFGRGG